MAEKRVTMRPKQDIPRADRPDRDRWVQNRSDTAMKRFTIDVPAPLHARIKASCALRGVKMADEIRALLVREFPET